MRDFNQAALDAHLAEISANLTPEQAEQFKRTAKQRIADSGTVYTDGSVDGAFDLIGYLAQAGTSATDLPDKIASALSAIDPRKLNLGSLPGADIAGQTGDAISGAVSGLGRMLGSIGGLKDVASGAVGKGGDAAGGVKNLASDAFARAGELIGGADGLRQSGISAAGEVVGFGGNVASGIGGALGGLQRRNRQWRQFCG